MCVCGIGFTSNNNDMCIGTVIKQSNVVIFLLYSIIFETQDWNCAFYLIYF